MMNTVLRGIFGLCLLLFGLLILEKGALATFTVTYGTTNDVYFQSRGGGYVSPTDSNFTQITHQAVSNQNASGTTFYCTISLGQNSTGTDRRMKYTNGSGTDKFLSYILYTSASTFASPVIIANNTSDTSKLVSVGTSWTSGNARNLVYKLSISPTGQTFDSGVLYRDFVTVTGYTRVGAGAFNLIGSFVLGVNCTPAAVMSITVGSTGPGGTLDLGVIRNSEEVPFHFSVNSSSKYDVQVQSENAGKLKHTNDAGVYDAVTSTIPYSFYYALNSFADLSGGGLVTIVNNSPASTTLYKNCSIRFGPTAVEGLQNINGSFNSGTTLTKTSGKYKDIITFTVTDGQ